MVGCKHEIKTHCQEHTEPNGVLNCLKVCNYPYVILASSMIVAMTYC